MSFAPLVERDTYWMRRSPSYRGDLVERRVREINGKRYEFTRVTWGDGSVTVRAYRGNSAVAFREVTRCGGWATDPEYFGAEHTCGSGINWGCELWSCDGNVGD